MRMRGVIGLIIAAVIAVVLLVPRVVSGLGDSRAPAAASGTPAAPPALPVDTLVLEPTRLVERLATTGTVRANEQVDIVSEVTGIARSILFREGAPVEKGQLLVQIDDTELRARRESVRHRLRLVEMREERQRELRSQGIVSEQEYDVASSDLSVLRAELELIDAQIRKTAIRAPFSGVIGLRHVSEGSLLSPQTRIATLQDLDPGKVDFTLPERYAGLLKVGHQVAFRVRGSEIEHMAEIYAVEPRIDPETRSLVIRARAANPEGALLPGAFADVSVVVREFDDALMVPALAVVPELGGARVFVMQDGTAQPRRVETGIRTDEGVQIVRGVMPGERIIISQIHRLRAGLPVSAAIARNDAADERTVPDDPGSGAAGGAAAIRP